MASHIRHSLRLPNSMCTLRNMAKLLPSKRTCTAYGLKATDTEVQNELFTDEQRKQVESVGRIEKITVKVKGPPDDMILYMNQDLSTPYDCARHVKEYVLHRAALAMVDSTPWHMHQPLTSNCDLKFLYLDDEDPDLANKVFWESCSILLGQVISNAFKDDVSVVLVGYPEPKIKSGSFIYDAKLSLNQWKPTIDELKVLSAEMVRFCNQNHKFERLSVSKSLALKIMGGNSFKEHQVERAASMSKDGKVTLYRVGNHIDICKGPLLSHTSFLSRCSITAVHPVQTAFGEVYRFQGVAIPKPLMLNHVAYEILERRARKLNNQKYTQQLSSETMENSVI